MTICYVDEVGCSSIAGPVVVCAVVLKPEQNRIDGVKDSKQLSKAQRNALVPKITAAFEFALAESSIQRIAEINIHWAKYEAMREAILSLVDHGIDIDKVIVDGKFVIPDLDIPQEAVVKADAKFWQTGAASIVAKVHRDNMMANLTKVEKYSHYDWENNAGYYSPKHRDGVILHGPCDLHRTGFVYFKYCLERHEEFTEFVKNGNTPDEFFKQRDSEKKSDYTLWKESKKKVWQPILPNMEEE